jgi:hypothetical protein
MCWVVWVRHVRVWCWCGLVSPAEGGGIGLRFVLWAGVRYLCYRLWGVLVDLYFARLWHFHFQIPVDSPRGASQWCEAALLHVHGGEDQDQQRDRVVGGSNLLWG